METAFGFESLYSFSIPQYNVRNIPLSDATFKNIQVDIQLKNIQYSESKNAQYPLGLLLHSVVDNKMYWLDSHSYLIFFKSVINDNDHRNMDQNIALKNLLNNAEREYIIF